VPNRARSIEGVAEGRAPSALSTWTLADEGATVT
jgi:hypothetical protein